MTDFDDTPDGSRGLFVSIDGPGGAGKTTVAALVADLITAAGMPVTLTQEPSHDTLGQLARQRVNDYGGHALACLVAADRYQHLAVEVRPALASGHTVICDRYVPSSYVLQRLDGVPIPFIAALNSAADRPHLAVILAGDPDVLAERVHSRGSNHRYETGADSAEREAILYREAAVLLASDGWTLTGIDTTRRHPDQVAASIAEHIERLP